MVQKLVSFLDVGSNSCSMEKCARVLRTGCIHVLTLYSNVSENYFCDRYLGYDNHVAGFCEWRRSSSGTSISNKRFYLKFLCFSFSYLYIYICLIVKQTGMVPCEHGEFESRCQGVVDSYLFSMGVFILCFFCDEK